MSVEKAMSITLAGRNNHDLRTEHCYSSSLSNSADVSMPRDAEAVLQPI